MKYIKHSFFIIFLALNIHFAQGITPIDGDIVFTQVSSTNNFFEFVTLVDGLDLTSLKITDNGVTRSETIASGEGTFDLSSTGWTNVPGGTFVRINPGAPTDNDPSDRVLQFGGSASGNFSLNPTGDQLVAYLGTPNSPTYIAFTSYGNIWAIIIFRWIGDEPNENQSHIPTTTASRVLYTSGGQADFYFDGYVDGDKDATLDAVTNGTWTRTTGLTEFEDQSTKIGESALPVELTYLTASISNDRIILEWQTATEVNNYGFEIEKSSDASSGVWEKIGFVEGHGNSYSPKDYLFIDMSPKNGENNYRLKQIDTDGGYEYFEAPIVEYSVIEKTELYQNHPNPFNPTTTITFSLREPTRVNLTIYNAIGQKVADLLNKQMAAGEHSVVFNASGLATGFYLYRIDTPNFSKTMKMILLR